MRRQAGRRALTPWSGTAPKTATATFTIDQGCTSGFTPALSVSALSTAAGRPAGATTMTVSRTDADQNLKSVTANLPPGLAGSLKGVPPARTPTPTPAPALRTHASER